MITDIDTGEIIWQSRKVKEFFALTGGEQYIKMLIDCLFRGVRQGRDLSITINLSSVKPKELDLFSVEAYQNLKS